MEVFPVAPLGILLCAPFFPQPHSRCPVVLFYLTASCELAVGMRLVWNLTRIFRFSFRPRMIVTVPNNNSRLWINKWNISPPFAWLGSSVFVLPGSSTSRAGADLFFVPCHNGSCRRKASRSSPARCAGFCIYFFSCSLPAAVQCLLFTGFYFYFFNIYH